MPKVLVLGATGATGSLLVKQLLCCSFEVTAIVRSASRLPDELRDQIKIVEAAISEFPEKELKSILMDCDSVVSCLGHNLSFNGVYGQPRRLVKQAIDKVCRVAESLSHPLKVVLMSSSGVQNQLLDESTPLSQKAVISILRHTIPPHKDNEQAAAVLVNTRSANTDTRSSSTHHCNTTKIEWVIVRPDTLIDEAEVTAYDLETSPIRNVIFDAGQTSRINVANFMTRLLSDNDLWQRWQGKMPVIYNTEVA
jgi:nucleoside-diphosphate-sugar epimerase